MEFISVDNMYTPLSTTYSAYEYVVDQNVKYPSVLPKDKQEKFEKMLKEDGLNTNLHLKMWNPNWIYTKGEQNE
jgi:hypothetical protein